MSILKLTKNGPVPRVLLSKDASIQIDLTADLLSKMQIEGLIGLEEEFVSVTALQRVRLAVSALQKGSDPVGVSLLVSWQEFEAILSLAFEEASYRVIRNVRFRGEGRRWEIDIVGFRDSLVVCADCKHWQRSLSPSILRTIVSEQIARTRAFARSASLLTNRNKGTAAKVIPILLSIFASRTILFGSTPVVPVSMLRDFLDQLPMHLNEVFWLWSQKVGEEPEQEAAERSAPKVTKKRAYKESTAEDASLDTFMSEP